MRKSVLAGFFAAQGGTAYDVRAAALFAQMTALGETPTDARKTAINNCIVSLKAADLFTNQFDVFVVTKAHGAGSGLLNWIKDSSNGLAVNSPTFTVDSGYKHVAATSYIDSRFNPTADGVLYTQDDACFGVKYDLLSNAALYDGLVDGAIYTIIGGNVQAINGAAYINLAGSNVPGYNCNARDVSNNFKQRRNTDAEVIRGYASTGLPNINNYILCYNGNGTPNGYRSSSWTNQFYYFGKYLSHADHLLLMTIMDTYFATI